MKKLSKEKEIRIRGCEPMKSDAGVFKVNHDDIEEVCQYFEYVDEEDMVKLLSLGLVYVLAREMGGDKFYDEIFIKPFQNVTLGYYVELVVAVGSLGADEVNHAGKNTIRLWWD